MASAVCGAFLALLVVGLDAFKEFDSTAALQKPLDRHCTPYRGEISGNHVAYSAYLSHAWGNLLSEFWEARATAALWGKSFKTYRINAWHGTWLRYLPEQAPPADSYTDWKTLDQVCEETCKHKFPMFPHKCMGSWVHIRGLIINETQSALLAYSQKEGQALPGAYSPSDVLVHLRFELGHPQMSWPGRSFFEGRLPSNPAQKVIIVHQPIEPPYEPILAMYKDMLRDVCGGCHVVTQTTSQFYDFATMATAPTVFCASSTYCLWAAMGNPGTIYFPGEFMAGGQCPDIGRDFFWVSGHSLGNGERKDMAEGAWVQKILDWVPEN